MYVYGTWLVWLLELVYCQLFVGLGMPAAQLRRRSGLIRGALRRPFRRWRLTRRGSRVAQSVLPLTARSSADASTDAAAATEQRAESDKADAEADTKPEAEAEAEAQADSQEAAAAQSPQQAAGELAEMNLSDALSGESMHQCQFFRTPFRSQAELQRHRLCTRLFVGEAQRLQADGISFLVGLQSRGWQTTGCWG